MERSLPPRVIVFDLGGVLVPPEGSITDLAAHLGVTREAMTAAYWPVRDAYDLGGPAADFWGAVTATLDRPLGDVDQLDAIDSAHWSTPAPASAELLLDLSAGPVALSVLSNAPLPLARTVRAAPWSDLFATLLFSAEAAVMKPDAAIYHLSEELTGCSGTDVVFFDDRPANVEGARAVGWDARLWTGAAAAREALAARGALSG